MAVTGEGGRVVCVVAAARSASAVTHTLSALVLWPSGNLRALFAAINAARADASLADIVCRGPCASDVCAKVAVALRTADIRAAWSS